MEFRSSDLTKEKRLWQIRLQARKIPSSMFNQLIVFLTSLTLTMYAFSSPITTRSLSNQTREIAEIGFNFSASILGFLIAGFTVVATVPRQSMFHKMAEIIHDGSGLNYLKYNFFSFMRVFIDYLLFCFLCIAIRIFAFPNGPLSDLLDYLPGNEMAKRNVARIGFIILSSSMVYVLLLLKSFVFNIYHIVMTGLRWSIEEENET